MRSSELVLRRRENAWRLRGRLRVHGVLQPPADKSMMHRALLLAALAEGNSRIVGLPGDDVLRTAQALRQLGIPVHHDNRTFEVLGKGLHGLHVSRDPIDCGNSGTTMRLLSGLLAAQPFASTLQGDASLMQRPMQRVAEPLRHMGACVETTGGDGRPPVRVGRLPGAWLQGRTHRLPIDSAQVRTAILLAGLYAHGPTTIQPASAARDHTQRMLAALGVPIRETATGVQLLPTLGVQGFAAFDFVVPGDASSAAFAVALASALPGARLRVEGCGLNPGRIRYLDILRRAGASIEVSERGWRLGEPWGQLRVRGQGLRAMHLQGDDVVACIDEVPALAAAGAIAACEVQVRDAGELRFKESDRIHAVVGLLAGFGARVRERRDGFSLASQTVLRPAHVSSGGDHRIAMAAAMLASCCEGDSIVEDVGCVSTSYPGFAADFNALGQRLS